MTEAHGSQAGQHGSHGTPAEDEEDVVRTPLWLPFVGVGLLLTGALFSYLYVYPGTLAEKPPVVTAQDGDSGDATAAPENPTPAAAH